MASAATVTIVAAGNGASFGVINLAVNRTRHPAPTLLKKITQIQCEKHHNNHRPKPEVRFQSMPGLKNVAGTIHDIGCHEVDH